MSVNSIDNCTKSSKLYCIAVVYWDSVNDLMCLLRNIALPLSWYFCNWTNVSLNSSTVTTVINLLSCLIFMIHLKSCDVWPTGSALAATSDIHRQMPTHMADIRRDRVANQNTDWCFVVIGLVGRQSHSPLQQLKIDPVANLVRHIGWHLAESREYLLTFVASTVSRRIYIHQWYDQLFLRNKTELAQIKRKILQTTPQNSVVSVLLT